MAICRCKERHSPPKTKAPKYTHYVTPIGYPATSTICGRSNCIEPALIWLDRDELNGYNSGQRVFSVDSKKVKVKADDNGAVVLPI